MQYLLRLMPMLRLSLLTLILLFSLNITLSADMQSSIVVIDLDHIITNSHVNQDIILQSDVLLQTNQQEMLEREKELKIMEEALIAKKGVIDNQLFEKEVMSFHRLAHDAQQEFQNRKTKLDQTIMSARTQIYDVISSIVAKLAKKRNFILALPKYKIVFYSAPELDITEEVLVQLNKEMPKLKLQY